MKNTLASRLKRARLAAKVSQSALARAVKLSPQAIQALEAGTALSSKHLPRIADALKVDTLWLAEGIHPQDAEGSRAATSGLTPAELEAKIAKTLEDDGSYPADGPIFVVSNADGRSNRIPLYLLAHPHSFYDRTPLYPEQRKELLRWIHDQSGEELQHTAVTVARDGCVFVEGAAPILEVKRPEYLEGVEGAYAATLNSRSGLHGLSKRTENLGIMFVCPASKNEIDTRDIIIVWHKSNVGIIGEVRQLTDDAIYLICDVAEFRYFKSEQALPDPYLSLTNDQVDHYMKATSLALPYTEIKAVHRVDGVQFKVPRNLVGQHSIRQMMYLARKLQTHL